MLLCEELVDWFVKILKRKHEKTFNLFGRKYDTAFRMRSSLRYLNCSCQKMSFTHFQYGCPQLMFRTSQNCAKYCRVKALLAKNLRHCYLFANLFLGSSSRSLPLSRIFMHKSLKKTLHGLLAALQW